MNMLIGILHCGHSPEELREEYGDYNRFFIDYLGKDKFDFKTYTLTNGQIPEDPNEVNGWLITGSRHSVNDNLSWIEPLKLFVRKIFYADIPLVGICFGHQLIAQALGGVVERNPEGWVTGLQTYSSDDLGKLKLLAWHQDHVIRPPASARTLLTSDYCTHAMLAIGQNILTIQAHPEFSPKFVADIRQLRQDKMKNEKISNAADIANCENESQILDLITRTLTKSN